MPETRDQALARNVNAILRSLDMHEVESITDEQWRELRDDPWGAYLDASDERRAALWAAVQRRLPAGLRESVGA